jgi:acyl-coenzyme A thioesterase PaaI-like protein
MEFASFQDKIPDNHCFGCGPLNEHGLRLESHWDGEESVARFEPRPEHSAGPPEILNGGIIATIIDCHGICTAIADAYRQSGREIGVGDPIWYVTGRLEVDYRAPTPIGAPVELRARVAERQGRKTRVNVRVSSGETICAQGSVLAIRVRG